MKKKQQSPPEDEEMLRAASRWSLAISQAREAAARGGDLASVGAAATTKAAEGASTAVPPPPPPPRPRSPPPSVQPLADPPSYTGGSNWLGAPTTAQTLMGRLTQLKTKAPEPRMEPSTKAPAKREKATAPPKAAAAGQAPPKAKGQAGTPAKGKAPVLLGNPLLVLCDMNGTLVHRSKTKLPAATEAAVVANGTYYYARSGAENLVRFLLESAVAADDDRRRVVFAFYTSMREANALPIAKRLSGGKRVDIYERKFNKDDADGDNDWDTMRDLPLVWRTPGKVGHGFDETNTVVIDDTHRKMREYPNNVLVVPTYDEPEVCKGSDDALEFLQAYIDALIDEPGDVRQTIDDRPFRCVV